MNIPAQTSDKDFGDVQQGSRVLTYSHVVDWLVVWPRWLRGHSAEDSSLWLTNDLAHVFSPFADVHKSSCSAPTAQEL